LANGSKELGNGTVTVHNALKVLVGYAARPCLSARRRSLRGHRPAGGQVPCARQPRWHGAGAVRRLQVWSERQGFQGPSRQALYSGASWNQTLSIREASAPDTRVGPRSASGRTW